MAWLVCAWLPAILLVPFLIAAIGPRRTYAISSPSRQLGLPFQIWLIGAVLCGVCWQRRFANASADGEQRGFHKNLARILALLSVLLVIVVALGRFNPWQAPWSSFVVMIFALVPLVGLIGQVQRFNFLQIGRQRNLTYAVFMVFVALLYLSFVRRAGQWLDPYLPPEASAALWQAWMRNRETCLAGHAGPVTAASFCADVFTRYSKTSLPSGPLKEPSVPFW